MRLATLSLALLLAPAALAQPCDPAQTDEACPDTTDWHRYVPLEVGNMWQYQDNFYDEPIAHWSWTITGQTDVEGQSYFELERCDEAGDGSATCAEPVLIRYDDEHALIVRRTDSGETWWDELPCSMAADFNSELSCTGPALDATTVVVPPGQYGASVTIPPDVVSGNTKKQFDWQFVLGWEVFADLGVTEFYYELQGEPTRLVYANVGGEQVGTPAFASCDPADADPDVLCPDTTDWRQYFPLAVGNRWQYEVDGVCGEEGYPACRSGLEVVGSEIVEGMEFFQIRTCREGVSGDVTCAAPLAVRYDEGRRTVVYEDDNGTLRDYLYVCSLALPFGFPVECDFGDGAWFDWGVYGQYGGVLDLGAGPSLTGSVKSFDSLGGVTTFFAGIGRTYNWGDASKFSEGLVYAHVDGVEYGTPAFVFPTPNEPGAAQPVATAFTQTYPNPARGTVRAQYTLGTPQAVTLELVDLLGRRVRSVEMGPQAMGPHDVRIDLGGLRPGVYVLRLLGDAGAEAAQRIVVVR